RLQWRHLGGRSVQRGGLCYWHPQQGLAPDSQITDAVGAPTRRYQRRAGTWTEPPIGGQFDPMRYISNIARNPSPPSRHSTAYGGLNVIWKDHITPRPFGRHHYCFPSHHGGGPVMRKTSDPIFPIIERYKIALAKSEVKRKKYNAIEARYYKLRTAAAKK